MAATGDLMVETIDMHAEHNMFPGPRSQLCYPIPCLNNDRADENLAMNLEGSRSRGSQHLYDSLAAQPQTHQTNCTTPSESVSKTRVQMIVNPGLTPEAYRQLRLAPEASMRLIATLLRQAESSMGTQMSADYLCSANALLDNFPHDDLRVLVHLLMRRVVLLSDDMSCLHNLIREMNASEPAGTGLLLRTWVHQLEAAEMAADGEHQQALAHLQSGRAEVWPYELHLIPSVVIHSAWYDNVLLEALLHYKMGDFDATLRCFQGIVFSVCFPQGLDRHRKAVIQAIARLTRLEYPTDLSSQIIARLDQAIPLSGDPRILLCLFAYDLECTINQLPDRQDCHAWWRKLDDMPTTKCSLFLKVLASVKRSVISRRSSRSVPLDSIPGEGMAYVCEDLVAMRSWFEPSSWFGPMLIL